MDAVGSDCWSLPRDNVTDSRMPQPRRHVTDFPPLSVFPARDETARDLQEAGLIAAGIDYVSAWRAEPNCWGLLCMM